MLRERKGIGMPDSLGTGKALWSKEQKLGEIHANQKDRAAHRRHQEA